LAAEKTHLDTGVDMLLYPLRYGQTLFSAVGFIGTILGISGVVRDLPKVIEDQSVDGLMAGFYVAFDTTFLGLLVAALLGISLVLLGSKPCPPEIGADGNQESLSALQS